MSVVDLSARRSARSTHDVGYLVCECGSAWFELCTIDSDGTKIYGEVSLNPDHTVAGYSGTPHCRACGREKLP